MPRKSKYRLTLIVMFSGEKNLERAISIFTAWCHKKLTKNASQKPSKKVANQPKNRYGFQKTGSFSGEFFLISDEYFEGWKLFDLVRDLETNNMASVVSFKCSKIVVPRKPAS